MSANSILLGVMGCLALQYFFGREIDRLRCGYCGVVRGHKQDCPLDHVEQNG